MAYITADLSESVWTAPELMASLTWSNNRKTGHVPATMTECRTCADSCPWKGFNGCYAEHGRVGMQFRALTTNGYPPGKTRKVITPITWDQLCDRVARLPRYQVWRHNVAGDLPGDGDVIDHRRLAQLVEANAKCNGRGFTYTHKPVGLAGQELVNAQAIYAANKSGFTISLSADGLQEADELADLGIAPVVCVVPTDAPLRMVTPAGRGVTVCPAETHGIQCNRCLLCAKPNHKSIVAFRAHGAGRCKVSKRLRVIQK
jgi:ferredoxin